MDNALARMLMRHEGENKKHDRHMPYRCSAGKLTLGWGRNIDDRGISDEEAMLLLHNDMQDSKRELSRDFIWFNGLDDMRQLALIDMHFNMGMPALRTFKQMITAFSLGHYDAAANAAVDSAWYTQVGPRAVEVVDMIRDGAQ